MIHGRYLPFKKSIITVYEKVIAEYVSFSAL